MLLMDWAKANWMGRGKEVIVDLKISEEDFLPFDIKQVKIQFYDELASRDTIKSSFEEEEAKEEGNIETNNVARARC